MIRLQGLRFFWLLPLAAALTACGGGDGGGGGGGGSLRGTWRAGVFQPSASFDNRRVPPRPNTPDRPGTGLEPNNSLRPGGNRTYRRDAGSTQPRPPPFPA